MATEKQVKMLAARAKDARMDFDVEGFKALDNGQIDEMLIHIAQTKAAKTPSSPTDAGKPTPQVNPVRVGLAAKLVFQENNIGWASMDPAAFIAKVQTVYYLLEQAEAAIVASAPAGASGPIVDEQALGNFIECLYPVGAI